MPGRVQTCNKPNNTTMDAAKIWTPIIILALLVGGIFLYRHLEIVDQANANFIQTRESLVSLEENLRARQKQWDDVNSAVGKARTKLDDASAVHQKAVAMNEEAVMLRRKVESGLDELTGDFPKSVQKVRTAALGTVLPSVMLMDGKRLSTAQIKKIEDNGMSFIHQEGFGVVPLNNLPADLIAKFDLGPGSIVKAAEKLKTQAKDSDTAGTPPTVTDPPHTAPAQAPATTPKATQAENEKLKQVQIKIAAIHAQLRAVAANKANWQQEADRAAERANDAATRGVPTSKHRADEANARKQINLCVQQTAQLEIELGRLQVEETTLRQSFR